MSAADDLAAVGKEPTPAQLASVYEKNGLPLKARYGKLVVPGGITPQMAEQLHRHEAGLLSALAPKPEKKAKDAAKQ